MSARLDNLIRELKKSLADSMTFSGKLYKVLMFTEKHQNLAFHTGAIWSSDYSYFWSNSIILGSILGIRPNSVNKNFIGSGFEIISPTGLTPPKGIGKSKSWKARRFISGSLTPEIPPPINSNWNYKRKDPVHFNSGSNYMYGEENTPEEFQAIIDEIEFYWYQNYEEKPPSPIEFAKNIAHMCGEIPLLKHCGIQNIVLNEIGIEDKKLKKCKFDEFCRKYGPPNIAANLLKDITDDNGLFYDWVQSEPKRIHEWDIFINPWKNTISLLGELPQIITLTPKHSYITIQPYNGVVASDSLKALLFDTLHLTSNPALLREWREKPEFVPRFDPFSNPLGVEIETNPEFYPSTLGSFLD